MLETILTMITTSVVFILGINIGYRLRKDEKPIELPTIKEIKQNIPFTNEYKQIKDEEKELEYRNILARNIDNYDGTSKGQVKIK